ncbi:hypothetical protein SLE2022_268650 [Rubroshorea leprosula]
MTIYGTIPSELPDSSSNFILRAREQIQCNLGTRRPWKEMIRMNSINFPSNVNVSLQRIGTNVAFFRTNYVIVVLFLLFLSLLWHPISLIVFIIMMALWLFLYFLRDRPVKAVGYEVDDRIVMTTLLVLTVAVLFLTDVTENVIVGLTIGMVVVLVHGLLRSTDDLFFVDDEEGIGSPALFRRDDAPVPLPLKHPASSSFSMS